MKKYTISKHALYNHCSKKNKAIKESNESEGEGVIEFFRYG